MSRLGRYRVTASPRTRPMFQKRQSFFILTLGADAPEISDLHQHAREHVGLVGAAAAGIDFQSLK